ncbi:Hypothetical protein SRAE_0000066400 [Strongyloides ratti]|uniref:Uncharacterized protein n=1 Tax=Strongyloides ratti TaxID=34506 RepID=A0A090MT91_STRRB|nr:Hypothetical protein SRAE_0000066400 [Strongyloides ratti]CEF61543.1 Hypothetical protein SRAE_0000066400 [Strongyloides ratti]
MVKITDYETKIQALKSKMCKDVCRFIMRLPVKRKSTFQALNEEIIAKFGGKIQTEANRYLIRNFKVYNNVRTFRQQCEKLEQLLDQVENMSESDKIWKLMDKVENEMIFNKLPII